MFFLLLRVSHSLKIYYVRALNAFLSISSMRKGKVTNKVLHCSSFIKICEHTGWGRGGGFLDTVFFILITSKRKHGPEAYWGDPWNKESQSGVTSLRLDWPFDDDNHMIWSLKSSYNILPSTSVFIWRFLPKRMLRAFKSLIFEKWGKKKHGEILEMGS